MQPLYTQKCLYIQKWFRSTSTGKEQEETQGWLKGWCYPVSALPNAAGELWVGGCTCAIPVPPCAPYLPPTCTHIHIHIVPALHNVVMAAVLWSRSKGRGSGKWSDRVWNTVICPSFAAIGKQLLQTPLFQKMKPQFHFPTKPENIKKQIFRGLGMSPSAHCRSQGRTLLTFFSKNRLWW